MTPKMENKAQQDLNIKATLTLLESLKAISDYDLNGLAIRAKRLLYPCHFETIIDGLNSLTARQVEPIDEDTLPKFSELYGMAPNATGGLPAEEFIAQQRSQARHVDVKSLKIDNRTGKHKNEEKSEYDQGWNACIDCLFSKGYLSQPKCESCEKLQIVNDQLMLENASLAVQEMNGTIECPKCEYKSGWEDFILEPQPINTPDTPKSTIRTITSTSQPNTDRVRKFQIGQNVRKIKGSSWQGRVVGFYSTKLTPIGYAVESEREPGSVQIYPEAALEALASQPGVDVLDQASFTEICARVFNRRFPKNPKGNYVAVISEDVMKIIQSVLEKAQV